jgi:GNAT superfamily N-acetyltransferase
MESENSQNFKQCTVSDRTVAIEYGAESARIELHYLTDGCPNKEYLGSIAQQFSRELGYPLPFKASTRIAKSRPFVIVEGSHCIGGGSFIKRTYLEKTVWCFQWLWLDRSVRKKRIYTALHEHFRAEYGLFRPEPPLSAAMTGFLTKQDPELLALSQKPMELGLCRCCHQMVTTADNRKLDDNLFVHVKRCLFPPLASIQQAVLPPTRSVQTYKQVEVQVGIATEADIVSLQTASWNKGNNAKAQEWFIHNLGADVPIVCVARVDGKLVGRLYVDLNADRRFNKTVPPCGIIDNVMIDPDHTAVGIGDVLIEFAEDVIKGANFVAAEIGVNLNQPEALTQYIRRHFHDDAVPSDPYTFFNFQHPLWNYIHTPRYERGVVFYKYFDKVCHEHPKNERGEMRDALLALVQPAQ